MVVDKHAPLANVTIRSQPTAPWYDAGCVNVKSNTRRLERFYCTRRTPAALDVWRSQLKYQRYYMQERYREYWTNATTNNLSNSKVLWSKVSSLLEPRPPSSTSKHTAEDFANQFRNKVDIIRNATQISPAAVIQPRGTQDLDVFRPNTPSEVLKIIMGSPDKQCSSDPAPTWLVKRLYPVLSGTIASICNASFVEGVLPPSQKHAIVRTRLKKPTLNPDDLNCYRPISNRSFLSKTIERVVAVCFNEHVQAYNLLPSR